MKATKNTIKQYSTNYYQEIRRKTVQAWCIILLLGLALPFQLLASHGAGAELTYEHISGNDYLITLNYHRSCSGITIPNIPGIVVESSSCMQTFNQNLTLTTSTPIPTVCPSLADCSSSSAVHQFELFTFEAIVTLPGNCSDWNVSFTECCRSGAITNSTGALSYNLHVFAVINNASPIIMNTSPSFESLPMITGCVGAPYRINLGVVEPDGDSLVFSLGEALDGPGFPVVYDPPFSGTNPFLSSTPITINPITGEVTFTPSGLQQSIGCIVVEEYRNGLKIGEVRRDFNFIGVNCAGQAPVLSGINGTADATGVTGAFSIFAEIDSTLCFDLAFFEPEGDTIVLLPVLPDGATFSSTSPTTATFCWTPGIDDVGLHLLTIVHHDNECVYMAQNSTVYQIIVSDFGQSISGKVALDSNLNCAVEIAEQPLGFWRVDLFGTTQHSTFTDQTGNYLIDVDTGNYVVVLTPPLPNWATCQTSYPVSVSPSDMVILDLPVQVVKECPYLSVDISTPFLRICSSSNYYVSYCNNGSAEATNAYMEIDFDSYLTVNSSTLPWSSQVGSLYTFQLGNIPIGACEYFSVNVTVDCDSVVLGQTHCVEAHIYPDSLCFPPSASWDGSITRLRATCEADSLTFSITNTGVNGMVGPLDYYVVEDNLIMRMGNFQLGVGVEKLVRVPSNGSTYRLYAEQAEGYFPPNYLPTVAVEGCGGNNGVGILNNLPEDDGPDFVSIDCQENIGPFDPNDKRAEPEGFGPEHYIEQNVDLDYHIRFQNVGTDTAFKVVILDTLSAFLDEYSVRPGASSHAYQLDIINNHVLKFTFNNIHLVDSTTNEPRSHGFVKFKIAQTNNLPLGSIINNRAAIYFDFNDPVITNETFHEIGEDFIPIEIISNTLEVIEFPRLKIEVLPNPFTTFTDFRISGIPAHSKTFQLIDVTGKVVHQEEFTGNDYRYYRAGLNAGVFFYSILQTDQVLGSGKLVVN